MAISTTNGKLALMEEELWEPALPISPGTLGQDDQQQLLWGFPEILWAAGAALAFVLDLNTRIAVFTRDFFGQADGDTTSLATRYMNTLSGDGNARFLRMIQDATDAMN